jgi:glycosyltransferase involved in cell wall biosynthesis
MANCSPKLPISLIIPCAGDARDLSPLLAAVESGTCWPAEVLVVDAGQMLNGSVPCAQPFASLVRVIEVSSHLFPGAARNVGCQAASFSWLAFLDLNTLPSTHWLEAIYSSVQQHYGAVFALGATLYLGKTWQQRLFITATYGERPLPTLPGTIVHTTVFRLLGGFLPGVRAGEDTDWLVRVYQFGIQPIPWAPTPLRYVAVPASLPALTRKWFRNYRSCAPVVFHLEAHKTVYFVAANLFLFFVAFNWNSLAADWRESSIFYVANVTKIFLVFIMLCYLCIRGLVMPLRRGSAAMNVLPTRWLVVGFVCAVLDLAKLLAFVLPPWRNRSGLVVSQSNVR